MRKGIFANLALKIITLILAVVTWLYIVGELDEYPFKEDMLKINISNPLITKVLPIRANIQGEPPAGFEIAEEKIELTPGEAVVIGPKKLLDKMRDIKTAPIDVSEYSKPRTIRVALEPIYGARPSREGFIEVRIPIQKTGKLD